MKNFCFTVDDNIRCLKELTRGNYDSIFEHPYLAVYKRLHKRFDLKIQLNLFYEDLEFDLSEMTDRYAKEWKKCSDWLKLSFHSRLENVRPYISSGYDEVYQDCNNVQREICRFASPLSLGKTTTVHYCQATTEGLRALKDCGRSVPDDCSVIGIDGLEMTEYTDPRLTTFSQPMELMGQESVQTLVSLIEGRSHHKQITVQAALKEGGSVRAI